VASFSDQLKKLTSKKAKAVDDDELEGNELSSSGVEIKRGDSRLKKGLRLSNLTASERAKVVERRKARSSGG